jgi:hypothetical protein
MLTVTGGYAFLAGAATSFLALPIYGPGCEKEEAGNEKGYQNIC